MNCHGLHICADRLEAMLEQFAQRVEWERALKCPCRSTRTGGALPDCPVCVGNGWLWESPVEVSMPVQKMQTSRKWAAQTEWEQGDLLVTVLPSSEAYNLAEYDRLTLLESVLTLSHVLTRGSADRLKYRNPTGLEAWTIAGNVKTDLVEGVDYSVTAGAITWLTNVVPAGGQYSVRYQAHPQYFVYRELVSDRRVGGDAMPRKVQVRLMDLMNRAVS